MYAAERRTKPPDETLASAWKDGAKILPEPYDIFPCGVKRDQDR
jgi:hypothetical protein